MAAMRCGVIFLLLLHSSLRMSAARSHSPSCGGTLRSLHGVLSTPNFPGPFPVPMKCRWVIDNSDNAHPDGDSSSILVFLTQLYATSGLTFTEFVHWEEDSPQYQLGRRLVHEVTERNVTSVNWLRSSRPFLVVEFSLDRLEGNHLRALDHLLDVYGFNLTYELSGDRETRATCSVVECSFSGDCYANKDFSSYACSCFPGYSGSDCGQGPLCIPGNHVCQKTASCRQFGSKVVYCSSHCRGGNCTTDEKGRRSSDCESDKCVPKCSLHLGETDFCSCDKSLLVATDRARYQGTIRLANLTAVRDIFRRSTRSLQIFLEKQIGKYLRFTLSNITELKVLDITSMAEVTFHFFGSKKDGDKVRELLNRLVERGRLGNLTLVSTHIALKQEPSLFLKSVKVNHENRLIREGDEFILSCIARGSSYMTFQWYKDGVPVNTTKALRIMWTELLPPDSQDQYTAVLGVERASPLDEGKYTCKVADWGAQQCRSVTLEVLQPPKVTVIPRSVTVEKGHDVSLICMSHNDGRHEKFGYNWTKNKALLPLSRGKEVWEDLHPVGSILKIYNIQKSSTYTCLVHGSFSNQAVSVQVEVIDRSVVPVCPAESGVGGLLWPVTSPNNEAIQDCPMPYAGTVHRSCSLHDTHVARWSQQDFSRCVTPQLTRILDTFESLTLGYENTTVALSLAECLQYLQQHPLMYPGEGEPVIIFLRRVHDFLNLTSLHQEFLDSAVTWFQILNLLLETENSTMSEKSVVEMQDLVRSEAVTWGSLLPHPSSAHLELSTLIVDVAIIEGMDRYSLHFPSATMSYPSWLSEKFDVHIEGSVTEMLRNGSITLAIIVYKNLSQFLPHRNVAKLGDGKETEYEINSHVVSLEVRRDGQPFNSSTTKMSVSLEMDTFVKDYNPYNWDVTCAVAQVVKFSHSWDLSSCVTRHLDSNLTSCQCSQPGSYTVLLTSRGAQAGVQTAENYHLVVLLGFVFCLLQTVFTLLLLLPYWWRHRSCLIYLKLQCCTATSGAMGVFIYAVRDSIPKSSFPYVTTSLEALLLIGMSSHLSKVLIVYTEVVQLPKIKHLKQTVVSVITGVPVLAVLCSHLAHDSTGWHLKSWWLIFGTMLFNIFVTSVAIMLVLFVFLYCSVMRKLRILSGKDIRDNKAVMHRVGFLKRGATVMSSMLLMEASSVCYINLPGRTYHYIFSFSSALLGFIIFVCYVWKSETPVCVHILRQLKLNGSSEEHSSESINSPLRFFTKQDGEVETEGAPPWGNRSGITRPEGQGLESEPRQGLLISEARNKRVPKAPLPDVAPSTVETYVNSEDCSLEDKGDPSPDADIQNYPGSPRKYEQDAQLYFDYTPRVSAPSDQGTCVKSYISFSHHDVTNSAPDIVTARVCVELGVITSRGASGDDDPAIVLCSVDVEPCQRGLLHESDLCLQANSKTHESDLCLQANIKTHETIVDGEKGYLNDSSAPQNSEDSLNTDSKELQPVTDYQRVDFPTQTIVSYDKTGCEPRANLTSDTSQGLDNDIEDSVVDSTNTPIKGRSEPTISHEDNNIDCMMNRISHDLDYLLNRKSPLSKRHSRRGSTFEKDSARTSESNT